MITEGNMTCVCGQLLWIPPVKNRRVQHDFAFTLVFTGNIQIQKNIKAQPCQ